MAVPEVSTAVPEVDRSEVVETSVEGEVVVGAKLSVTELVPIWTTVVEIEAVDEVLSDVEADVSVAEASVPVADGFVVEASVAVADVSEVEASVVVADVS